MRAVYKVDNKWTLFNEDLYSTENLIGTKTTCKCNNGILISTSLNYEDIYVYVWLSLDTLSRTFITNVYKRFKIIFYGKNSFINVFFVYFLNVYCIHGQDRVILTMLIQEGDHFSGRREDYSRPIGWSVAVVEQFDPQ